ncbi:MAG: response regulator transcription factor [Chloroflexi bacterium]|nr:response regulator transcription factor [Chloroflexota bacterium]
MKVLVVDDDPDLLDLTSYALRREGYTVVPASDGQQALKRWEAESPDLVLLDANMPRLDGFEVCRRIRQQASTPVIMLTARDDEEDILQGLQLGADDYVTKPYSAKQLVARMKAVLRRCQADPYRQPVTELRAGDLVLDLQSHEARKAGILVQLTPLEFRIVYMLAMNEGKVVPYVRLVEYAWGYDGGDSSLLKTHISHVRSKLGMSGDQPGTIKSIPGVGYTLTRSTA